MDTCGPLAVRTINVPLGRLRRIVRPGLKDWKDLREWDGGNQADDCDIIEYKVHLLR